MYITVKDENVVNYVIYMKIDKSSNCRYSLVMDVIL